MAILYYVDGGGNYIGAFEGSHGIDVSAYTSVPSAPVHYLDVWNGVSWSLYSAPDDIVLGFKRVVVSGQSDIVADATIDTLTIAAGSNITLTTNASTDTMTIAAASAGVPTTITVADTTDTTSYIALFESATGDLAPKTDAGATYNAATGVLTAAGFSGPLTGNVTGNISGTSGSTTGNAATVTTNANLTGVITSTGNATVVGTLTTAVVPDSSNKRYVTDAHLTILGNTSNTNTGDQTSVSGNAGTATALQNARTIGGVSFDGTANIVPQTITSADEASDTTCFPLFITASGTQSLQPKNNTGLTYNSSTNNLTATTFTGALSGNATTSTNTTGNSATVTTNANLTGDVTSSGNATTIGAGKVTEAMQVLADNATNNSSTSKHGYLLKLNNSATQFMNGQGAWATPVGSTPTLGLNTGTASITIDGTDQAKIVELTGSTARTFLITAAATLGANWWCIVINNSTAELTLDGNGSELDGLANYICYPGEMRLIQCTGVVLNSYVLKPFDTGIRTATFNFILPPGYSTIQGYLWGSGASGGKGATNGGGGGGGACVPFTIRTSTIGAAGTSTTCTVGAGGASQTTANTAGNAGNSSTFGTLFTSYGGGRGGGSSSGAGGGGGGSGYNSVGATVVSGVGGNATTTTAGTGGVSWANQTATVAATAGLLFSGGGGNQGGSIYGGGGGAAGAAGNQSANAAGYSTYGGGGGGGAGSTAGSTGGISQFGGSGGAGATGANNATGGTTPAGGGGGCITGNSGAGADGGFRLMGVA